MASSTVLSQSGTPRRRSKTEEGSSLSSTVTAKFSSFLGKAKRGQSVDLEREDRSHQLQEPLLETDDGIALVSRSDDVHSAPEGCESSGRYRRRAKPWRRGMRLPKGRRSRRKPVNDKFIDSSKNTPHLHYVKQCTLDNVLT